MKNSRFTVAIHVLAAIDYSSWSGHRATSEELAASVNTNPVVIRRLIASLRHAGLVESQAGVGGGMTLTRCPREISLLDIYHAVSEGPLFKLHPHAPSEECPIAENIQPVLSEVYSEAEDALERALARKSLADITEAIQARQGELDG